jgi:hypothetical protein
MPKYWKGRSGSQFSNRYFRLAEFNVGFSLWGVLTLSSSIFEIIFISNLAIGDFRHEWNSSVVVCTCPQAISLETVKLAATSPYEI